MNGQPIDHRAEAERLLIEATTLFQGPDYRHERAEKLAAAQVHATLAGPSTRTVEFVSRPAGVDTGVRDLLAAAQNVLDAADRIAQTAGAAVPQMYLDELAECVEEAREAGL